MTEGLVRTVTNGNMDATPIISIKAIISINNKSKKARLRSYEVSKLIIFFIICIKDDDFYIFIYNTNLRLIFIILYKSIFQFN